MDRQAFVQLMQTVARSWSAGDARTAADCFAEDAVYVEPHDRQRYVGRAQLVAVAGGDDPPDMSMTWHHLAFDPKGRSGSASTRSAGVGSTTASRSSTSATV